MVWPPIYVAFIVQHLYCWMMFHQVWGQNHYRAQNYGKSVCQVVQHNLYVTSLNRCIWHLFPPSPVQMRCASHPIPSFVWPSKIKEEKMLKATLENGILTVNGRPSTEPMATATLLSKTLAAPVKTWCNRILLQMGLGRAWPVLQKRPRQFFSRNGLVSSPKWRITWGVAIRAFRPA